MSKHSTKRLARKHDEAAELVIALAIEEAVTVAQHRNGGQGASGRAHNVVGLLITAGALQDVAATLRADEEASR